MSIPDYYTLVGGDDEFLVDKQAGEIFSTLKQEWGQESEAIIIDGRAPTIADAQNCLIELRQAGQNLSLFGEKKIIWLKQTTFLADNQTGKSETTKNALQGITDWLNDFEDPNTFILISASPMDRRKAFPKFFDKQKKLVVINSAKDPEEMIPQLKQTCAEAGVEIENEAAIALIDRVSGNARMMENELDKLLLYVDSEEVPVITYDIVIGMVSQYGDTDFFELTDAFYADKLDHALAACKRHFFTHKDARPILSSLQNRNRLMILMKSLAEGKWLEINQGQIRDQQLKEVKRAYSDLYGEPDQKSEFHLFGQNAWYLGRIAKVAARISLKALIDYQIAFVDAFSRMINHPYEQEQIFEDLIIRCHQGRIR